MRNGEVMGSREVGAASGLKTSKDPRESRGSPLKAISMIELTDDGV